MKHEAQANLTLTKEGKKRVKQNTCDHHWEADHDEIYCKKCELGLTTYALADLLNEYTLIKK